jgi:SOS-response transcriptional repressor LexA
MREIADGLGLKSLSGVDRYVYRLKDKEYIAKTPYIKRSIVVLKDIICE